MNRRTFWPVESREAFYVNGAYEARGGHVRPGGQPRSGYRLHRQKVTVRADDVSPVAVALARYDDLPARMVLGRLSRSPATDQVADLGGLDAGRGRGSAHGPSARDGQHHGHVFQAARLGKARPVRARRSGASVGQEDPRTVARGHTIHWNVDTHAHFEPRAFFQYHLVFERTRRGGAVTGYAHLGELFNGRRGLAIDVPFGLVDFIEVCRADAWPLGGLVSAS